MAILRSTVSRCATAWAESLERSLTGHLSWAILCRYRCRLLRAEVHNGSDRNTELNGHSCGRRAMKNSRTATHRAPEQGKENHAAADRKQRGERTCAVTARGSIRKAMKVLVGGAASGSAECRKHWTSLDPTELWPRSSFFERGAGSSNSNSVERRQTLNSSQRNERARPAARQE